MRWRAPVPFISVTMLISFILLLLHSNAGAASMKLLARAESSWTKGNLEKVIIALINQATPIGLSTVCGIVSESEYGRPLELEPRITLRKNVVIVELYADCSFNKDLAAPKQN